MNEHLIPFKKVLLLILGLSLIILIAALTQRKDERLKSKEHLRRLDNEQEVLSQASENNFLKESDFFKVKERT